jgi:DHA1 family tetracycline resistance protein-like MFS transporter
MLFVGRVLAGISGGSFATCSAYIADISNDENRAKNFGLIGIAFGVGFTIGPVIGGLLGEFGPRVPFLRRGCAFASPISSPPASCCRKRWKEEPPPFEWKRANPLGALRQMRHYPGIGWVSW